MGYKVPFVDPRTHYPRLKSEMDAAIIDCFSRGDLVYRRQLRDFEEKVASFVGVKYAVGVNSRNHGLHLSFLAAVRETRAIVTIEEHSMIGGLGGTVAEVLAESDREKIAFKRVGLPSTFSSHVGSQEYLRTAYGLSEDQILESLKPILDLFKR